LYIDLIHLYILEYIYHNFVCVYFTEFLLSFSGSQDSQLYFLVYADLPFKYSRIQCSFSPVSLDARTRLLNSLISSFVSLSSCLTPLILLCIHESYACCMFSDLVTHSRLSL